MTRDRQFFGGWETPPNQGRSLPTSELTREDIDALLRLCQARSVTGLRTRVLILLLARHGFTLREVLDAKVSDVVEQDDGLYLHGVKLEPRTSTAMHRWLQVRETLPRPRGALLCWSTGKPWGASGVRDRLHALALRAGIGKRVHPMALRAMGRSDST